MGVVKAMVGLGRSNTNRNTKSEISADVIREATMEDGLRHVMMTIDSLIELDQRFGELEQELLGESALNVDPLPEPHDLGLDGLVPRLMESALLIGAASRRMHLRMGVIEGAMGRRARPVDARVSAAPVPAKVQAEAPQAAAPKTVAVPTPAATADDADTVLID